MSDSIISEAKKILLAGNYHISVSGDSQTTNIVVSLKEKESHSINFDYKNSIAIWTNEGGTNKITAKTHCFESLQKIILHKICHKHKYPSQYLIKKTKFEPLLSKEDKNNADVLTYLVDNALSNGVRIDHYELAQSYGLYNDFKNLMKILFDLKYESRNTKST